jgi:N-acetylglucosaminyldiphosphoundecaprenol N-acetyl-beta-D-mannosaminyltransferase
VLLVTSWPAKQDVLGTGISITSVDDLVERFEQRERERAITVNVCNVHSVMSARSDVRLAEALAAGDANTPDGMPLVWAMRSLGVAGQTRVKGSHIAMRAFEYGLDRGWRHFFYGSTPETLDALTTALGRTFPRLQIAGTLSPPFRPLDAHEQAQMLARIRDARPDIVWVGLGMPKQEKWMLDVRDALPGMVLVGVGAAFDFIAGTKPEAPEVLQRAGLEWAFRLAVEPRRLWRRYAWNNPAFLALWLGKLALSSRSRDGRPARDALRSRPS